MSSSPVLPHVVFAPLISDELCPSQYPGRRQSLLGAAPMHGDGVCLELSHSRGMRPSTLVQVAVNDLIMLVAFRAYRCPAVGISDITVRWDTVVLFGSCCISCPNSLPVILRAGHWLPERVNRLVRPCVHETSGAGDAYRAEFYLPRPALRVSGWVILNNPLHIVLIAISADDTRTFLIFFIAYGWAAWRVPQQRGGSRKHDRCQVISLTRPWRRHSICLACIRRALGYCCRG